MPTSTTTVERALSELQRLVRRPPPAEPGRTVMQRRVPDGLASPEASNIALVREEKAALDIARQLL